MMSCAKSLTASNADIVRGGKSAKLGNCKMLKISEAGSQQIRVN